MANNSQNESGLPISKNEKRTTSTLLPRFYRTDGNKKFLQSTLDQLTQPGTVKKVNGYIGRQNAKAVTGSDIFIEASDQVRQNYQLEPAAVVSDYLGNTTFYKDYIDHINHISVFGGIVDNHERLNKQEFYSWNPHINWDMFVNYQNYYWLPYGPSPVELAGQQQEIVSTYTVTAVDEGDNFAYVFTPDSLTKNPTLTLFRGQTYKFEIDSVGNPFTIKTSRVAGQDDKYAEGVTGYSVENGTITFTVDVNAPDVLYYVSDNSVDCGGVFHILDIDENTFLNVETDVIGKKTYQSATGLKLSNGMKIKFLGKITPEIYNTGYWYVEGVGTAIKLIPEKDLEIISSYSEEKALLFDDEPFDQSPFSTATAFPKSKDYVVINRSSPDRNPWSRFNRWYHQDVIIAAAEFSGQVPELDQSARAIRPIIEFNAGLKLFNFGHQAKKNVDVIDNFTTDVFSTIEGSLGYNVDGIDLADGMRVLFTADTDSLVRSKIFKVNFINVIVPGRQLEFLALTNVNIDSNTITFETNHGLTTGNQVLYLNNGNDNLSGLINRKSYYVYVINDTQIKLYTNKLLTVEADIFSLGSGIHKLEVFSGLRRQINLVEESDSSPLDHETVLVEQGRLNQGLMYHYENSSWKLGQVKTEVNQAPLFDIFDINGNSYNDTSVYDSSTFKGTKLFSYKVGSGSNDVELGFPLAYQNINNIGDIAFEFNLLNDSFNYKDILTILTKNTDAGYLKQILSLDRFNYVNGWTTNRIENSQPIVRIFKDSGLINRFPVDVFDNKNELDDLVVKVYVNGKRIKNSEFVLEDGISKKYVVLTSSVTTNDIVTLKCLAKQSKNQNGYYEVPVSLQNNPLNNNLSQFTLGQVIDHVDSIIDNIQGFEGIYPGTSNLRDLGDITPYGTRFVQHSGSLNLSLYHFGSKSANVFKALEQARLDYGKFKRAFLVTANSLGIDTDPKRHVDAILFELAKDKSKTQPYYLSDMFGYTGYNRLEYTVLDPRIKKYPLSNDFNLTALTNKAVNIYLNGEQLVHGRDYSFGTDIFFEISATLAEGDIIEAYEYDSTDGCFCPPTPTKLGLFPSYEPKKYLDTTYVEPIEVIQGHDGSITLAFGDFRDDLILELEKRIFNNIKVSYNSDIFDIFDFIPGYNRPLTYSKAEFEKALSTSFFQWTTTINQDYTKQQGYDRLNPFTFNYRGNYTPDGKDVPAFWRGIYKWVLDTDRPHTHPWECLGYFIEPRWWQSVYGPAPYTKDNQLLWDDIRQGLIREPGKAVRKVEKFAKPILEKGYPVDEDGNLENPIYANFVEGYIKETSAGFYVFGDYAPVETAWRNSSYYPFAVIQAALLLQPNKVLGTCLDRSRIIKNLNNQFIYSDTGLRLRLQDIVFPSTALSEERKFTSGLINYIVDYITSDTTARVDDYKTDLENLTNRIGSKLGGFSSKPKLRILLDSKSPTSTGGVFVPEENYNIILNTSSPVKKVVYSGVLVTKYPDGFEVRGYNIDEPYFNYYSWSSTDRVINIGGISESFVNWESSKFYVAGKIVNYGNQFYRVKTNHQTAETFDENLYARLADLPVVGGREAILRKTYDTSYANTIAYGTKLYTIQEVVDFLQGYGAYLEEQGFVFDDFNPSTRSVSNWENAVKEFLFWTTQNWAEGAVISLSPAADKLVLNSVNSVVNDITDKFFEYKIFRVDGQKLEPDFANSFREDNQFTLIPVNTNHGIFGATLYLIQKEHVLLLDNSTLFNDIIYDLEPGYRQERIKLLGYVSKNWNGSFNIPGFIFDQAFIKEWLPWNDYNLGDIVKYKEFYYTAKEFVVGQEFFNPAQWVIQESKPEAQLVSNWDYRAEQFTDFYDLDTDNFDAEQQKLAQHLIGYQKRQYLENIIKDDVSQYKFYQGMIIEKGTQNVFTKLFDVLSADDQESLVFNEEWAVRVGNYGASSAFDEIEFILDESKFKVNPQPIELTNTVDPTILDFVYRQKSTDIYIKPIGYNNNPWSVTGTKRYLRTPGYVRYEDVKLNLDTLDNITEYDITTFTEGDYVWSAFEGKDWNVYRFTKTDFRIEDIEYTNGKLTVQCDRIPEVSVGDIIGFENSELLKGFHKISSINKRVITISVKINNWEPFADSSQIISYKFKPQRVANIDDANTLIPDTLKTNELIWADNGGNDSWGVFKNSKIYQQTLLDNQSLENDLYFGKVLATSKNGTVCAITDENKVSVYTRGSVQSDWTLTQTILADETISDTDNLNFGGSLAISEDGEWLAISAPTASNVRTTWQGEFDPGAIYPSGSIVKIRNTHWVNKTDYAGDGSTVDRFSQDWEPAQLVNVNSTAEGNELTESGYVEIYRKVLDGTYSLTHRFISPMPANNELFGSKMKFAKSGSEYVLAISSLGYNSYQGRVYLYRYSNTVDDSAIAWHMDYDSNYLGLFNSARMYVPGDIVFYNYELYRCLAEQDPTDIVFDVETGALLDSAWQVVTDQNILGYFPQDVSTDVTVPVLYPTITQSVESVFAGDKFGYDFSLTTDGSKLVISAPDADQAVFNNFKGKFRSTASYSKNDVVSYLGDYYNYAIESDGVTPAGVWDSGDWNLLLEDTVANTGKVFVYQYNGAGYNLVDSLGSQNLELDVKERFGESVALSPSGYYLAVGSTFADNEKPDQGRVTVLEAYSGTFSSYQNLYSPKSEPNEKYGSFVDFMSDDTLVVFAVNGDLERVTTFDSETTKFDNSTLRLSDVIVDSGRIDIYDKYNTKFIFGESLDASINSYDRYGSSIAVSKNSVLVGTPRYDTEEYSNIGKVFSYFKKSNTKSWSVLHYERPRPNVNKIKKAFLYNKLTNKLVSYIDIVDPIQGKIPGPADQEIKFKTYFDPAVYSVGTDAVNVDTGMNWTKTQVGMLWWDLTRAKFLENQGGETIYRSTTWSKLYDTAGIDIYEWVESKYLPSEWDKLSGTDKGTAQGITGKSRYGDSVYSIKKRYDSVSKSFNNTYFYWVKNKTTIPNFNDRKLSAFDVSSLIADPVGYGYTCLALTGSNTFSLVNATNLLDDKNIVLNVQYWLVDNQDNNSHSQWKIVSEHPNTIIPRNIEDKWFHSLIGKDDNDRTVPDTNLPAKLRYGIEFRPRQSMFINRVEALKQVIERVNAVLTDQLIVDEYDISDLTKLDPEPTIVTGLWDSVIDIEEELRFIGTATLKTAILQPVIEDGQITGAVIVDPGYGYVNAPYIKIVGPGSSAQLQTILDEQGRVTGVNVINPGYGYDESTFLSIRNYSVLVRSDSSTFDKWSVYSWNKASRSWDRVRSQAYDVTKFWNYIDWYAPGYNQFVKVDYIVENTYQLVTLDAVIGNIVKVKNIGSGGWLLLEKFNNSVTVDYTENYKVIGRQNGTIQFSNTLYKFKGTALGFDGPLFDSDTYDNSAFKELRIILDTIKNKLFVDALRTEYLKLFFTSVRYALSEQTYIDWIIKTSFVKATHNVGELKEKVTFNNDNLSNFEDYVNEVKPYRTKVREYISNYSKLDNSKTSVTDFDILPVVDSTLTVNSVTVSVNETGDIVSNYQNITTYPWKHWYDNVGFTVQTIEIVDGGSNYISRPVVKIEGGFGSGAKAEAYISNGKVNRIQLISGGTGYLKAPTITLDGGLAEDGVAARVVAIIESEVVRSNKISVKFDRVSKNYFVSEIEDTETFAGTGSKLQYVLKWSPNKNIGKSTVTVDGIDVLRTDYVLETRTSTSKGFTSYYGLLTLAEAPAAGAVIEITYEKDFNHLSAADRINFFYNPTSGQLGKDLSQLMTGIDYGGVNITGLGFGVSGGWDALPWFSDAWDGFDAQFDDYIVTVSDSTYAFTLPYVPAVDEEINIYVNGIRIDDPYFDVYDGSTVQPNGRKVAPDGVVMATFIGDGVTNTIELPNLTSPTPIDIEEGDKVIFRKSTSDGSFLPRDDEYDTQLSGGDLAYSSATGLSPEDILLDGDDFVTPLTSPAPEEVVPGQITDAVAIKVYQRPTSTAPNIMFKNYIANGLTDSFVIGQQVQTERAVIVKVANTVLEQSQYTFDWVNNSIILNATPSNKTIVSVISFGFNNENLLDLDYFVTDGSTTEYVTRSPWIESELGSVVLVNGAVVSYELFKTDDTYVSPDRVGIRFSDSVLEDSLINFMIYRTETEEQTSSVVKSQAIVLDGSTDTFALDNLTEDSLSIDGLYPLETNVIVRKGNEILRPSTVMYYTMQNNNLTYSIPNYKFAPYSIDADKIRVFVDGNRLIPGRDYVLDLFGIELEISEIKYVENGKLAIVVDVGNDYQINDNGTITILSTYAPSTEIEVITFYNHVLLNIDRTTDVITPATALTPGTVDFYTFNNKLGGRFKLRRTAVSDDFVWVIKNGVLLTHSVDYVLEEDHITVRLKDSLTAADEIQIMSFNDRTVKNVFGFMQFKDMLNRVHYKRLRADKATVLAQPLLQKDAEIVVEDATVLTDPNPTLNLPGIVEINGERIEFFVKNGNSLTQLRRGTLGTGTPSIHAAGETVQDIGVTETIPYRDQHIVETSVSDGSTKLISLNYVPEKTDTSWYTETIPTSYGQSNELDVFVGGYRLKKTSFNRFEETNSYPYSPEGDTQFEAEFSVDGSSKAIRLTSEVPENTKIVVIKKLGKLWTETGVSLADSSNQIANFLKEKATVWPR